MNYSLSPQAPNTDPLVQILIFCLWCITLHFFFKILPIYFFERECKQEEDQRERDRKTPHGAWNLEPGTWARASRGVCISGPWDHDQSWNQESDAQPAEPPRNPVSPLSKKSATGPCQEPTSARHTLVPKSFWIISFSSPEWGLFFSNESLFSKCTFQKVLSAPDISIWEYVCYSGTPLCLEKVGLCLC